mgnify:CR=1 FL=1
MKKRKSFSLRPREGARETKLYNELGSWLKTTWVANGEGFFFSLSRRLSSTLRIEDDSIFMAILWQHW